MSGEEGCLVYLLRKVIAVGLTAPPIVAVRARTVATLTYVCAFGR